VGKSLRAAGELVDEEDRSLLSCEGGTTRESRHYPRTPRACQSSHVNWVFQFVRRISKRGEIQWSKLGLGRRYR